MRGTSLLSLGLLQQALVDGELNGLGSRASPKVVHSGLQPLLPSIEVHAGQLAHRWGSEVHIQTLALANERATVGSEVQNLLLGDFPDSLVDSFDVVGNVGNGLYRPIVGDNHVLHIIVPQTEIDEVAEQPGADNLEFSSEHTTSVDVAKEASALFSTPETRTYLV